MHTLLTRPQAAALLGVSESTLATWASTRRVDIPYIRVGRCARYRMEDIQAFIAANTVGGVQ